MSQIKSFLLGLKFYIATNWIANTPSFRLRHWYYRRFLHYTIGKDSSIHMGAFVTGNNIKIDTKSINGYRDQLTEKQIRNVMHYEEDFINKINQVIGQ